MFKRLLHVSTLRSSSGSTYCSLLKLHVKTINTCLYVPVMQQHIMCMCICCICRREVGRFDRQTSLRQIQHIHIHIICCCITGTYKQVFIVLTCNFSKEQYVLPEDDLRIETCRSLLTLRLLMSYIYGAPSKARNANVVYIWTYVWQRRNSLFLFAAQCCNTESMQRGFLCHICV